MPPDRPTLLLTRPARQAASFLAALSQALGRTPAHHICPVLAIAPRPIPDPGAVQALVFTSANGVTAFADQHTPAGRPAYCVGDSTAEAAATAGFDAHSAQGDGDRLLARLVGDLSPDAGPVVHVSGARVAGDLVGHLRQAGYDAQRLVAYDQVPQKLDQQARDLLRSGPVVAPVFSPRSAMALHDQLWPLNPPDLTLVAISQDAAIEGPGLTLVAREPSRQAMIDVILPLL